MKCPHCGGVVFESSQPIQSSDKSGPFDDVVMFGGSMIMSTAGAYVLLWQADIPYYWAAPCLGLTCALGLAILRSMRLRPEFPKSGVNQSKIVIDVKDKSQRGWQNWQLDAFAGCRPLMLYKFSDAVINKDTPITRRRMMKVGVSQGQFELIRLRLLERGWVDAESDLPNARVFVNWRGRAVLRGVLRDSPTPSSSLVGRGWMHRQPPHHHPTASGG